MKNTQMLIPTLLMAVIAIILFFIAWHQRGNQHVAGMKIAWGITLQTLPLIIFAFLIAGFVQILIPVDLISRWVGAESGLRGIFIGTVAGGITPGGPYVSLPIAAGFLQSGASIPTTVAFLTSWSLWAVARLPMEFGIMGWKFTVIRLACTFFFPPLAGFIALFFEKILQ